MIVVFQFNGQEIAVNAEKVLCIDVRDGATNITLASGTGLTRVVVPGTVSEVVRKLNGEH